MRPSHKVKPQLSSPNQDEGKQQYTMKNQKIEENLKKHSLTVYYTIM